MKSPIREPGDEAHFKIEMTRSRHQQHRRIEPATSSVQVNLLVNPPSLGKTAGAMCPEGLQIGESLVQKFAGRSKPGF
jgi:hypothetical protein